MPLYLKVVLPIAALILGLTVPEGARSQQPTDAIAQAQTPKDAPVERPEQKKTAHDLSDVFNPSNAVPSSEALTNQTDRGQMNGFDFYRDPLGATRPGILFPRCIRAGGRAVGVISLPDSGSFHGYSSVPERRSG